MLLTKQYFYFFIGAQDYIHIEIDTMISESKRHCINVPIIDNFLPGSAVQFSLQATSRSHNVTIAPSIVVIMDDGM